MVKPQTAPTLDHTHVVAMAEMFPLTDTQSLLPAGSCGMVMLHLGA